MMLGCEGLICKGEEQSEKRGFQRGWNLPIRAKGNNARCWMRTQSTNKQTLLRVGNCE